MGREHIEWVEKKILWVENKVENILSGWRPY